jgi:hypothetical protein
MQLQRDLGQLGVGVDLALFAEAVDSRMGSRWKAGPVLHCEAAVL